MQLAAILAIAIGAASATGLAEAARISLAASIDANWRGAYDLLVRPSGSRLPLESTNGLVEPNFLGFDARGGISTAQLDAIRAIPGVDVAAPIAVVGRLTSNAISAQVHLSTLPDRPTLYRLDARTTTTDGLRDLTVDDQGALVLVGPADLSSPDAPFRSDLSSFSWSPEGIDFELRALPPIASTLMAIDPVAERQLLGPSAGALDRLADPHMHVGRTVASFDLNSIPGSFRVEQAVLKAIRRGGDPAANGRVVAPILVSDSLYAHVTGSLTITEVRTLDGYPADADWATIRDAAQTPGIDERWVGSVELDLTRQLAPFQTPSMTFVWPGSSPGSGVMIGRHAITQLDPRIDERAAYSASIARPGGPLTFRLEPASAIGSASQQTDYRTDASVPFLDGAGFVAKAPDDQPFHLVPVGTFDLDGFLPPANPLNYVPFGAYDPPRTTLVADPNAQPVSAVELLPTLNPRGLVTVPPLAITDIAGAVALRGDRPIDAIRVRVGGIEGYSPQAIEAVEAVANWIAALGLEVDVVAGSSPQPIELFVPRYFGPSGADLGFVSQQWTTIGAAVRSDRALSDLDQSIAILGLIGTILVTIALAGGEVVSRRREALALDLLGWSTAEKARWLLAPPLAGMGLVGAFAAATWLALDRPASVTIVAAAMTSIVGIAGVLFALPAIRTRRWATTSSLGRPSRSAWLIGRATGFKLAVRVILAAPRLAVLFALAGGAFGATVTTSLELVAHVPLMAGPTSLALALVSGNTPFELVSLLASAASAAIACTAAVEAQSRRIDAVALVSAGWPRSAVLRLERQIVVALGIGSALAAASGAALVTWLLAGRPSAAAIIGSVLAATALTVVLSAVAQTRRR